MPWVEPDIEATPLPRTPRAAVPPTPLDPSAAQIFGAGFRQDNPLVNLYRRMHDEVYPHDPNHNPKDVIRGTDYEAFHSDKFIGSFHPDQTRAIMRRIDEEDADRKVLAASGVAGFVAQVAAGTIDPTIALPGGVIVRSIRGGYSVSRSAVSVGIAAAGQTAAQEAILQGTQETRTAGESAVAIASGAIIGGILGGGASALLTRVERRALEKALDADRAAIDAHATGVPAPAGAAATDARQLEMFKTPLDIGPLKKLSVTRRTLLSQTVEARRVVADTFETPYSFKESEDFVAATQGPALDLLAKMNMDGEKVLFGDEMVRQFADYRFGSADTTVPRARAYVESLTGDSGGKLSYQDFKREVSLAWQNNGVHAIPQVAAAAKYAQQRIEPWVVRAEQSIEGFRRLTPVEGEAHFPHNWNKSLITARRPQFTDWLTGVYKADQDTKRAIQGRLAVMQDDLAKSRAAVEKAKDPDALAAATLRHDELRTKIEEEIGRWEGKSVSEAKAAIKAREKYAAETGRATGDGKPRLTSADSAIDDVVEKIIKSDRDRPEQELRDRASQTVVRIIGSPDGRLPYDEHMGGPRIGHQDTPPARGSLAGRQLNVTNAQAREWIENDVEEVFARTIRTFIPDVMLAEKHGDVEMTQAFRRIEDAYSKLADATKGEAALNKLEKERRSVLGDIAGMRDRMRGVYGWSTEASVQNMARFAQGAKAVNNIISGGTFAISSLPDLAGTMIHWGVSSAIRDGWTPFFRGLTGRTDDWGKFTKEVRALGIGVETAINARQHTLDDMFDVYKPQSRVERTLQTANDKFFIANFLAPLTDGQKQIAAHVAASNYLRFIKAATEGKETKVQARKLADAGIDRQMAERIQRQLEGSGGGVVDGIVLPNTGEWKDRGAVDAFWGAVVRDVNSSVVTPGQEKPFIFSKPVASLLFQFQSFTAAATERILVANLQTRDASALAGIVFSVGLGMLSYKLNSFFGGQKTSDRPQDWFKEGAARSGVTGWLETGNALASKLTRGSVDIHRLYGADKPLSRFASRSAADMLLGPTWGKIETMRGIVGSASAGDWSAADTSAVRRLVPLQNLLWLRGLLNQVEQSTNSHFGVPERKAAPTP